MATESNRDSSDQKFGSPYLTQYHHVQKVRATYITLDRRTTMMAFIQCTDLHALPPVTQTFYAFTKKFSTTLIQILLNSIDCFIVDTKNLVTNNFDNQMV